jgi:hypothetical protein
MALALKSNVYSDIYITGNCIVTGTMTTLANPVNSLMTILQDQKAQGTTGGTNGTGWQTRTLNTTVLDQISVGLTTNQFTLPAGTYHVQISTPACQTNNHRCRLYNVTTSTAILLGTSECAQNSNPSNMSNRSFIDGYFTSVASGTYRIDQYFQTAYTSGGLGMPSLSGGTDVEIYTTVKIIKINSGAALNQWTTGGTSLFYNSGNVGIGTTSPTHINAAGSLIHVYGSGTDAPTVRIDATGGTGQARLHVSAGNGGNYRAGRVDFFNFPTSTTVPTNTLISDYDQNGTNNFDFVNFAGTRTMTIKQSGYVGIGTTSPENKLDITDGSIVVAPTTFGGAANYGLFFRHGFSGSNFYNCSVMAYDHNGDTNPDGISINGYDGVSICTGSNTRQERMRVTQAGLVGIGSATPATALDVAGVISTSGLPLPYCIASGTGTFGTGTNYATTPAHSGSYFWYDRTSPIVIPQGANITIEIWGQSGYNQQGIALDPYNSSSSQFNIQNTGQSGLNEITATYPGVVSVAVANDNTTQNPPWTMFAMQQSTTIGHYNWQQTIKFFNPATPSGNNKIVHGTVMGSGVHSSGSSAQFQGVIGFYSSSIAYTVTGFRILLVTAATTTFSSTYSYRVYVS